MEAAVEGDKAGVGKLRLLLDEQRAWWPGPGAVLEMLKQRSCRELVQKQAQPWESAEGPVAEAMPVPTAEEGGTDPHSSYSVE